MKAHVYFIIALFIIAIKFPLWSQEKPNIIIVMYDDLGIGDLKLYNSLSRIRTPTIEKIANSSIIYTNAYAGSAVCTPSRASILTGIFPAKLGISSHFDNARKHLSEQLWTIPKILNSVGYETFHVGKWHLGGTSITDIANRKNGTKQSIPGPLEHGFKSYLSHLTHSPGLSEYWNNSTFYSNQAKFSVYNDSIFESDKFLPDQLIDYSIQFIERSTREQKPFFLNLWFYTPHEPLQCPPGERCQNEPEKYKYLIEYSDQQLQRLINYLIENDLYNNTILILTSDNGPAIQGSAHPYTGRKTDLYEGGIKVPFLLSWPQMISGTYMNDKLTHHVDIFYSITKIFSHTIDGLDGAYLFSPQCLDRILIWQLDQYSWHPTNERPNPHLENVIRTNKYKYFFDSNNVGFVIDMETNLSETHEKKVKDLSVLTNMKSHAPLNYTPILSNNVIDSWKLPAVLYIDRPLKYNFSDGIVRKITIDEADEVALQISENHLTPLQLGDYEVSIDSYVDGRKISTSTEVISVKNNLQIAEPKLTLNKNSHDKLEYSIESNYPLAIEYSNCDCVSLNRGNLTINKSSLNDIQFRIGAIASESSFYFDYTISSNIHIDLMDYDCIVEPTITSSYNSVKVLITDLRGREIYHGIYQHFDPTGYLGIPLIIYDPISSSAIKVIFRN